jgi:hypothetical protein
MNIVSSAKFKKKNKYYNDCHEGWSAKYMEGGERRLFQINILTSGLGILITITGK